MVIIDWFLDGATNWIAERLTQILDTFASAILGALGPDLTVMETYFPFMNVAYSVFLWTGVGLIILMLAFNLLKVMAGPILNNQEHPVLVLLRAGLFFVLIFYSKEICMTILGIAKTPFVAMWNTNQEFDIPNQISALSNYALTKWGDAIEIGPILQIIFVVAIGWNYIKILLEAVERYIVVGLLCYSSPLAVACGSSKDTGQVLTSWGRMMGSQLLLLIMNVWFIRAFNSAVGQFTVTNGGKFINPFTGAEDGSMILWLFCVLALLKAGQRVDSYMASMGINAAQTGSQLGAAFMGAVGAIRTGAGAVSKGVSGVSSMGKTSPTAMNPITGQAVDTAVTTAGIKVAPGQAVTSAATNAAGTRQTFGVSSPEGLTRIDRQKADAYNKPHGAHIKEVDKDGTSWYKTAEGPAAKAYLSPQFGDHSANQGFVLTPKPDTANQFAAKNVSDMYRKNYSDALASKMSYPEALQHAQKQTVEGVYNDAKARAMLDGMAEPVADQVGKNAAIDYQKYQNDLKSTFGDNLPAGAVIENDPDMPGVMHMYGTDEYGQPVQKDMYLDSVVSEPDVTHDTMYDNAGNAWHTVDVAQPPESTDNVDMFRSSYMPELQSKLGSQPVEVSDYSEPNAYEVALKDGRHYVLADMSHYTEPKSNYTVVKDNNNHGYYAVEGEKRPVKGNDNKTYLKMQYDVPKKGSKPKLK